MSQLAEHAIIGSTLITLFLIFNYSLHRIEEGYVGVYYRVCDLQLFQHKYFEKMLFLGRCAVASNKFTRFPHDGAFAHNLPRRSGLPFSSKPYRIPHETNLGDPSNGRSKERPLRHERGRHNLLRPDRSREPPEPRQRPGHRPELHRRLRQNPHLQQGPPRAEPILQHPHPARSLHRPVRPDRREPQAGAAARSERDVAGSDHPGRAGDETQDPGGDSEELRADGGREDETAHLDAAPEGGGKRRGDGEETRDYHGGKGGASREDSVPAEDHGEGVAAADRANRGRDASGAAEEPCGRGIL